MAVESTQHRANGISETKTMTENIADRIRVRFPEAAYTEFRDHLVREEADEHAGYLIAGIHQYTERRTGAELDVLEYLVHDVHCMDMDEYARQGPANVTLSHETLREATFDAIPDDRYLDDQAIIFAHSHPFQRNPTYSSLDDRSEPMAFTALTAEGDGPHASLLFGGDDTLTGRVWPNDVGEIRGEEVAGTDPVDEVIIVGEDHLRRLRTTDSRLCPSDRPSDMHDRQALVHGKQGNDRLQDAHVAVAGAGGLGSLLIQSLAHLGIGELTVVDPDVVEETNRSRIVGAQPTDAGPATATPDEPGVIPAAWAEAIPEAGRPKVEVMQRLVENIDPSIRFHGVHSGVESPRGMQSILKADIVISATDTASSRVALSHAAKQYHRPLFDAGTNINITDGVAKYIATRLSIVTPGMPCLDCQGEINWDRVTAEQKDPEELEYGVELLEGEAPAVITINQQAAARLSFAVHRYLSGLLADRTDFDTGVDELITSHKQDAQSNPDSSCKFCGNDTFAGVGDRGPSPATPQTESVPPETGLIAELGWVAIPEAIDRDQMAQDDSGIVSTVRYWVNRITRGLRR